MEPARTPAREMLKLLRPNAKAYLLASVSTVMVVFLGYATPLLLAETIDCILSGKPSTLPHWFTGWLKGLGMTPAWIRENLWILAAALVLIYLLNGVFGYIKGRMSAVAS